MSGGGGFDFPLAMKAAHPIFHSSIDWRNQMVKASNILQSFYLILTDVFLCIWKWIG